MKKRIAIFAVLAVLFICLLAVSVSAREITASGQCGDNLTWTLYADKELVIEGTGDMWDYDYDNTYGTTAPWGKYGRNITVPSFSEGITSIGKSAFLNRYLSLEYRVAFPKSLVKINDQAFRSCCGLHGSLVFHNSLESIGKEAFKHCCSITNIIIPESTIMIDTMAFESCLLLEKVVIYSKDVVFGDDVFANSNPELIIYGYLGSTAEAYAKANNHKFVELSSRKMLDYGLCGSNNDVLWILFDDGELHIASDVHKKSWAKDGNNVTKAPWVKYKNSIKKLSFADGVKYVSGSAFSGMSGIGGDLIIPDSVIDIGLTAFYNCSGFDGELVVGNKVRYIAVEAFYNCSGFSKLTLGDSVETIENYAFYNCSGFTVI